MSIVCTRCGTVLSPGASLELADLPHACGREWNMSVKEHPNLHAAGLIVDVLKAVETRLRGKAVAHWREIAGMLASEIGDSVEHWNALINGLVDGYERGER